MILYAFLGIPLVMGLLVIINGKFKLSRTKQLVGTTARVFGGILFALPFLSFAAGIIAGVIFHLQGMHRDYASLYGTFTTLGFMVLGLIIILVSASNYAVPISPPGEVALLTDLDLIDTTPPPPPTPPQFRKPLSDNPYAP
ncbi:MAG: hypothetical protein SFX18_01000 [Pirellulales bacterium]|nr:hypothetical protein [Pirellulales bacterium]